jgi:hypothetical protein
VNLLNLLHRHFLYLVQDYFLLQQILLHLHHHFLDFFQYHQDYLAMDLLAEYFLFLLQLVYQLDYNLLLLQILLDYLLFQLGYHKLHLYLHLLM